MGIEEYMMQTIDMPIAFPITCFIMGCLFYFVLDGLSGLMTAAIQKLFIKIKKEKKENPKQDV